MRIGIDGRELVGHRTGVGHYLAALCTEWLHRPGHGHRFVLYTPVNSDDPAALGPPFADRPASLFSHRPVAGRSGTWWEQVQLPKVANRDALDVFFAPAYSAPLRLGPPSVVTMHDVSFAAHPEWFRWREGLRRRWLAAKTMARAAAVLTVSEFSRDEILRLFDVSSDRVHVVLHGLRRPSSGEPDTEPHAPLVLYAGSIFNRRQLPTLIRAFAQVVRVVPAATLAIVGTNRTYPRQDLAAIANGCGVAERVTLHGYVTDETLNKLCRRAGIFVFLSEYEGFGLPPLEALAAGVPILVGDTQVAREVYGDAALFVPPHDASATAKGILALLLDDALRSQQAARAATRLPSFSWERAARETLSVIVAAARAAPRT